MRMYFGDNLQGYWNRVKIAPKIMLANGLGMG
jgi:hypothetical protein